HLEDAESEDGHRRAGVERDGGDLSHARASRWVGVGRRGEVVAPTCVPAMVRAGRLARERNGVPGSTKARNLAVPGLACSRDWTRTSNRPINSRMLCQLSYAGSCGSTLTGRRRGPGVTHGRPGCELGRTSAGEADGLADAALERVDLAVGLLAAGQRAEGGDLGVQAPVLATADDGAHPGAAHLDGLVVDHGGLHALAERG